MDPVPTSVSGVPEFFVNVPPMGREAFAIARKSTASSRIADLPVIGPALSIVLTNVKLVVFIVVISSVIAAMYMTVYYGVHPYTKKIPGVALPHGSRLMNQLCPGEGLTYFFCKSFAFFSKILPGFNPEKIKDPNMKKEVESNLVSGDKKKIVKKRIKKLRGYHAF